MYNSPHLIRHYNPILRHSAICVGRMHRWCIDMNLHYKLLDDLYLSAFKVNGIELGYNYKIYKLLNFRGFWYAIFKY